MRQLLTSPGRRETAGIFWPLALFDSPALARISLPAAGLMMASYFLPIRTRKLMSLSSIWSCWGSVMCSIEAAMTGCSLCSAAMVRTMSESFLPASHLRRFWVWSWLLPAFDSSNGAARARMVITPGGPDSSSSSATNRPIFFSPPS